MPEYKTLNADPETKERIDAWIDEHTNAQSRTEGLRLLIEAAEQSTDGPDTVTLEAGEVERIGDEIEGRLR